MVLKTGELFVRQRSQTANAMRGHMAELGIIAATGMTSIAKLIAVLRDDRDERLPSSVPRASETLAQSAKPAAVRPSAFQSGRQLPSQ
jgi:transposase